MQEGNIQTILEELGAFLTQPNAYRSVIILALSVIFAYWLSHLLARVIIKLAQFIALRADNSSDAHKQIRLRRIETYLSVAVAAARVIVVAVVAYAVWRLLSPAASTQAAAIGASALFIVLAGGTIGVMLRDITAGATMIIEHWFNIGDYIRVEPFIDVSGVVERATLRSIKIRSLNGEVIRIHNQHIHGVKVTPKGIRTLVVDVFVNDPVIGRSVVEKAMDAIPIGTLLITKRPKIHSIDKWGEDLWRIMVYCYTAPGREWLMEQFFVDSIKETDRKRRAKKVLMYNPIVRFADPEAERNFKRAIRVTRDD